MNIKKLFLLTLGIPAVLASGNHNDENANPMGNNNVRPFTGDYHPCLTSDNEPMCRATEQAMNLLMGGREQFGAQIINRFAGFSWFSPNQNTQSPVKK